MKKNFEAFLQLNVGTAAAGETLSTEPKGEENEFAPIERFFENYPPQLPALKEDFERVFQQVKNKEEIDLAPVHGKLTDLFKDDEELNMKVTIFTRSLAPELRKPEIENRYRLNYLLNKYKIPDFET
ncbi:MAG: hypothetical protein GY950_24480 [bacterium]|nr:hypothetical protein [bacterium]